MATIEEIAKKFACRNYDGFLKESEPTEARSYVVGATDQQEIDIQKALKRIFEHLANRTGLDIHDIEQVFLDAMKGK